LVVAVFLCSLSTGGLVAILRHKKLLANWSLTDDSLDLAEVAGSATNGKQQAAKNIKKESSQLQNAPPGVGSTSSGSAGGITQNVLWHEDFSRYTSASPSSKYWNIADSSMPIYNNEAQIYQSGSSTVRVANGVLVLEALRQGSGIVSGRIDTKGKVNVSVGTRLEAKIRLPKGRGTWPAFWLLSDNQPHTSKLHPTTADWEGERFYMWDGEIDIMESYGQYQSMVEATLHTFDKSTEKDQAIADPDGWHTYWMEWRSDAMVLGVDATTLLSYPKQSKPASSYPFTNDNKYYVILNLAMGGDGGGPIISSGTDRWRMEVASITAIKL